MYSNPDFVRHSESYGAIDYRPNSDEGFNRKFSNCLTKNSVHIIDLFVDYSLNHSILNILLKEKTCIL